MAKGVVQYLRLFFRFLPGTVCSKKMSRKGCSPFGRDRKATKPKAAQYDDQPANFWFLTGPKAVASKSRVQADSIEGLGDLPGAGTVVAVLDTGIQRNHRAFSNYDIEFDEKVILCKNFVQGRDEEDWEDVAGHGTQCAGLACGLTFQGVDQDGDLLPGYMPFNSAAPGARLMVCKVGHGDESEEDLIKSVIAALKYIIEFNKRPDNEDKKVDVISISIGFTNFQKELANAVQEAVTNDIIIVCCASNDGANISNPITYPARLGHVLCIGACDKHGQPAKFSAEGREVDFVELGVDVWVPNICDTRDNEIAVLDGTSFSTPFVAGLVCVLIQDLKRLSEDRRIALWENMHNVWCMRDLLKSMSVMHGHHDSAKGYGKLMPREYFKKGDEERVRICNEILGR